jgi:3-hydroxybutyryl-CoA dehydrogenase
MSTHSFPVDFSTIGIVGAGTMGRGIAESALRGGCSVVLCDTSAATRTAAEERILTALGPVGERLRTVDNITGLTACDLVIEAVPENAELKSTVLRTIEEKTSASTVIATNTSSLSVTQLASSLADPGRFLGLHFFNPVPKMPLVEVIPTEATAPGVTASIERLVEDVLGKRAFVVGDRPGFVVNALLIPYLLSAARMLDAGYASAQVVDDAMVLGCGLPIGPLALSDFVGLDVLCDVADAMHEETGDPALVVPDNLRRLVASGHLGRKTGDGFFPRANHRQPTSSTA